MTTYSAKWGKIKPIVVKVKIRDTKPPVAKRFVKQPTFITKHGMKVYIKKAH